jgi:uncharacterized membrane protein/predicted DsbA family dithiol-disulfide isomerase
MAIFVKKTEQIKPFPFYVYFWTVVFFVFAGLANSIYLSVSHYRVYTDTDYVSFCALSQSINCDTVSQSLFSIFLGLPVPVWGIIGYSLFLLLSAFAGSKAAAPRRLWTLLFFVSVAFCIYSIILAAISTFHIRSFCIMCIVSYGINFLLLFYTWMIRKRFDSGSIINGLRLDLRLLNSRKVQYLGLFSPLFIGISLVLIFFPVYWSFEPPTLTAYIPHGITEEGHPWVGAENPQLEIIEFADYQCFQCNKIHFYLRQIMAEHPGKIRLIHRHFPMDHAVNPIVKQPVHVGSGKLAMLTIYAATQNKFWQMSDILFSIAREKPVIDIKELAQAVGLNAKELSRAVYDSKIQNKLKKDIADALKFGITGTPSFVIDGKLYRGQIPPEIIKKVMN